MIPQPNAPQTEADDDGARADPLFVQSVEKAFRVLTAFNARHPTLSLSQLAAATSLDKSAAQRFAHTLERLGYLRKNAHTKHFELTTRTLAPAYCFTQSNPLVQRAIPYLVELARMTEEAVNLSMLERTLVVFVARFMSPHVIAPHVTVGTLMPAYCTAAGIALLSRLPPAEAEAILRASNLRPYTPQTTWRMPDLLAKAAPSRARGYAICVEEMQANDISVAAPILGADGRPVGAVNIAVSQIRCSAALAEQRFAPLVISAAEAISG